MAPSNLQLRTLWQPQRKPRALRCPACGRAFHSRDRRVRIGGVVFHRRCAVYEPAARDRAG